MLKTFSCFGNWYFENLCLFRLPAGRQEFRASNFEFSDYRRDVE
jgi:hypothetical protein